MTCICALVDNKGTIYMGGDSAGVAGLSVSIRSDEKVFVNGPFIMGFTSSFRMGNLLRYKFSPPKHYKDEKNDMEYMTTDFVDGVRRCFANNGFGSISSGGTFLVGYNKTLYLIDSDFQVGIDAFQMDAIGCGSELALGSLHSTSQLKIKPEDRIKMALSAAVQFNAGVRPPFTILKL